MNIDRRELIQRLGSTLGTLISAPTFAALLSGCDQPRHIQSDDLATMGNSNFFGPHQKHTVSVLAETILPKTNTPGAIDAGVPTFIESVVRDVFDPKERMLFSDGLFSLDLLCSKLYENNFNELPPEKQATMAYSLNIALTKDKNAKKILVDNSHLDVKTLEKVLTYFALIKELTIFGFYTSEIGATQVLHYNPIPGRYDGCASMEKIGKTWATPK